MMQTAQIWQIKVRFWTPPDIALAENYYMSIMIILKITVNSLIYDTPNPKP